MKRIKKTLIILLLSINLLFAQDFDTLLIRNEILNLNTFSLKKKFLDKVYKVDQAYRGEIANDSIDFYNLLSMSYFINEYGYPLYVDYGRCSGLSALIWIHNSNRELKKISFPIILKGYSSGEITSDQIRIYYLNGIYKHRFDDDDNRTMPIKELFDQCEVLLDTKISISQLIKMKDEIETLKRQKAKYENTYELEDIEITNTSINRSFFGELKAQNIKVIEKIDGKTFILNIFNDNSGELTEIQFFEPTKARFKDRETDKYFKIENNGLFYMTNDQILKKYRRTSENHD